MQMLPADELGHGLLPTTIRHRDNAFATLQYHHATVKDGKHGWLWWAKHSPQLVAGHSVAWRGLAGNQAPP
jgi:hypothetical protein